MHMADALLSPAVGAAMYAATGTALGVSLYQLKKEDDDKKLPLMAVSAALVFAGQMINYTIPGTGSSGHICGGMLLSALLGPWAGFLSMAVILVIQCLFFADGGLLALGANIWNMAFYGCFVGYFLIWRPLMKSRMKKRTGIVLASLLGCTLTLQLGAFSVVLETSLSGITELPFGAFLALMQPIHLAIGLIEGAVTAAVLLFVYGARPELLMDVLPAKDDGKTNEGRLGLGAALAVLAVVTALVGGGFSLLASSNPDGLEWTLFGNSEAGYSENMGLDEENFGIRSSASEAAAKIQEATAILPDYQFAGSESPAGTSVSGLAGSAVVAVLAGLVYFAGKARRKKYQSGEV